ncbi:Aspartyl-tRNA(Asn) amidotransferase subunit C @ Glutamyl-tRNA(Gln) amidotransferase subunit C [hydrothermal vent metagenome]|uniref:Aspartyl-tRNA(Asn) amidotransferase subunit C @ Glutamyl-tRNA(Gln) amidotransferase subunit C n=1 Tax=hydrothermal vent metagenome TaxID=652676 RepID=A0A1W1BA73_9ZZZZ
MQIDEKLLSRLEKLSMLKISEEKRETIIKNLSEFLEFAENLKELDTSGIDATFAMDDEATITRKDIPSCETEINESILKNAPKSQDHFFIVPKIIE